MAIREYLQDVLHLNERDLLQGRVAAEDPPVAVRRRRSTVSAIPTGGHEKTPAEANEAGLSL